MKADDIIFDEAYVEQEFAKIQAAAIDAAVDLLYRYDPEQHNAKEYVVRIARAVLNVSEGDAA